MTTPRDDISGLTDYLRKAAMALYLAIDQTIADELSPKIEEAATQLDSLLKERDALQAERDELRMQFDYTMQEFEIRNDELKAAESRADALQARVKDQQDGMETLAKEHLELARDYDKLQARVKELEAERSALVRDYQCANWQLAEEMKRATRLQQERDEAYERAAKVAESVGQPVGAGDGCGTYIPGTSADAARAIRRLAGPEKIAAANDGEERR